jgi:hypothetical protein
MYLKKIVIFYREVNKSCENADDLLNIYEELLIKGVKNNMFKDTSLFRMKGIIEKLIKVDEWYSNGGGEISYAWTNWCIILEVFKGKINE